MYINLKAKNYIDISDKIIGDDKPTYFIADIAANHNGDIQRAINLIHLAAEAGADAAKFQHFEAQSIVSDFGFKALGEQQSHQAKWSKTVFEVYRDAEVDLSWTAHLKDACDAAGITFFTSPYSFDLVDIVDPYVPAYKIGSGDITWLEIIEYIAAKNKPIMIASGASSMDEVHNAICAARKHTNDIVLMQCNTNYTASLENFKYINLNVLKAYGEIYPDIILGLSDHTPGHSTVLGAVTLGARVIEKHFTDSNDGIGPDHKFSMTPSSWREMVMRTRELEISLGGTEKKVEDNELDTVVLQRRSIRYCHDLKVGEIIGKDDIEVLRPCPNDGLPPSKINDIIGRTIIRDVHSGEIVQWRDLH